MDPPEHQDDVGVIADADTPNTPLHHDSMVTVRLSEPPSPPPLTVDTQATPTMVETEVEISPTTPFKQTEDDEDIEQTPPTRQSRPAAVGEDGIDLASRMSEIEIESPVEDDTRRGSESSEESISNEVNWEELQKTEDEQPRDQDSEDVRTLKT
jgi:hypothetical protein